MSCLDRTVPTSGRSMRRAPALRLTASLMTTTAIVLLIHAASAQDAAGPAAARSFDIPAQPLASALATFRQQSGLPVAIDATQAAGRMSQPVKGTLPPQEALRRLLAGTGITTRPAAPVAAAQPAADAVTLPAVSVLANSTAGEIQEAPLQQAPDLDKTGTKIQDLPGSVVDIPRQLVVEQGGTTLRMAIDNSSGISEGGADDKGFFDRFLIRGLDARIYEDGFSDGDQINGIPHSLNGVESIEILKGPGSALFGSGPPGGTINLVHFAPSSTFHYGTSLQVGSFGTVTNSYYVTGPTGVDGLTYRIDASLEHSDGFRDLKSADYEIRPVLNYVGDDHNVTFAVDARHLENTPDSYGLIYVNGSPIKDGSINAKFSSPFDYANQNFIRVTLSDAWTVGDHLTINNRFSYTHRVDNILENGDSGTVTGTVFSGRQLRSMHDDETDYDYQLEPVWKFNTGPVAHTLLTGFEVQRSELFENRATASLPNITNIFAPVVPETSTAGLVFLRDAKHSGVIDNLDATYLSLYGTDQIDVTDRLKVRLGVRQDWWDTTLTPEVFVPGRTLPNGQLFEPGVTYGRRDQPVSWNAGVLYKILPNVSPYFGVSQSSLANFTAENTTAGIEEPESALQFEGGLKMALLDDRVNFTTAVFEVRRNNVFDLVGDTGVLDNQSTKGVEADLQVRPTSHWTVFANATSQHAELTSNPSQIAATGKEPQGVPAHIFNLWTTYNFSIANLDGFQAGVGVHYRDRIFGNILNTDSVPSYTTVDAALAYRTPKWDLALNLKNLTNTRYFIAANGAGALVGDPLSVFFSASLHM
jgi:iron complex outermembrane receptor protein